MLNSNHPVSQPATIKKTLFPRSMVTVIALLSMLICAQTINGGLSLSAFKQLHLQAIIAEYSAGGDAITARIERALRFGKPLNNFIGLEKLLHQGKNSIGGIVALSVLDNNGETISANKNAVLPPGKTVAQLDNNNTSNYQEHGNKHYLLFPLHERNHHVAGYLCLEFSDTVLANRQQNIIYTSIVALGWTTVIAALLLAGGFFIIFRHSDWHNKRIIYIFVFCVLGSAQIGCSYYNIKLFQHHYLEITQTKATTVARLLQHDINFLLKRGLQLHTLINIDKQMQRTVERVQEIGSISICDTHDTIFYHAGSNNNNNSRFINYLPISKDGQQVGKIKIALDSAAISSATTAIAMDSATIVALLLLFIVEMMILLFATLLRPLVTSEANTGATAVIRPATFIYIYSAALCYSFIPLYMQQIYQPIAGLSRQVVLGLPLTIEMLAGGLILIPVGHWIDRRGWHQPFIAGIILSIGGAILSALAAQPLTFMAARGVTGIGYGMVWMSAQGCVLLQAPPAQRARALSNVVAGIFSGIICGNAVGSMLAQHIGYCRVFFVAATVGSISLLFTLVFMRRYFIAPSQSEKIIAQPDNKLSLLLRDRKAMTIFTCSLLPYSIAMVGILYYISPLYLHQIGSSQATIGRVIMLFGLCMIFIAPRVSALADRIADKRLFVYAGGILASSSLIIFICGNSFWIVPTAVLLFGLSVSVSGASRNLLTIGLPVSNKIGTTRVIGVYRSVDKIAQALGPLFFALLLSVMDIPHAMATAGGLYFLLTLLLMWGLRCRNTSESCD